MDKQEVLDKLKEIKWEPVHSTDDWQFHFQNPSFDYERLEQIKKLWDKHISLKEDEIIINKSIFPKLWKYKNQYYFNKKKG